MCKMLRPFKPEDTTFHTAQRCELAVIFMGLSRLTEFYHLAQVSWYVSIVSLWWLVGMQGSMMPCYFIAYIGLQCALMQTHEYNVQILSSTTKKIIWPKEHYEL